jgi:3-carboxy-cis,cis-muconate cycloisomerase
MNDVSVALDGMIQEHERDMGAWQMEWAYLPECCIMTDGALHLMTRVLSDLHVRPDRMVTNLAQLDGLILSEAIILALGQNVGRQTAHDIVSSCAMRAAEEGRPFRELLTEHPIVRKHVSPTRIEEQLNPREYVGFAGDFINRVVQAALKPVSP